MNRPAKDCGFTSVLRQRTQGQKQAAALEAQKETQVAGARTLRARIQPAQQGLPMRRSRNERGATAPSEVRAQLAALIDLEHLASKACHPYVAGKQSGDVGVTVASVGKHEDIFQFENLNAEEGRDNKVRRPRRASTVPKASPPDLLITSQGDGCQGGQRARKRPRRNTAPVEGRTLESALDLSDNDEQAEKRRSSHAQAGSSTPVRRSTRLTRLRKWQGQSVLYGTGGDAVLIPGEDLRRLGPGEFLNDTLLDFYIKYLQRPDMLALEEMNRFHFCSTFFFRKLQQALAEQSKEKDGGALKNVHRWNKKVNIFGKEYCFVPVNQRLHWSLAIICFPGALEGSKPCILHLDSVALANGGHNTEAVAKALRSYLNAELQRKYNGEKPSGTKHFTRSTCPAIRVSVPQQQNDYDCGLFLLFYIQKFMKEAPRVLTPADIQDKQLFGQRWFKAEQASQLRGKITEVLHDLFVRQKPQKEAQQATEKSTEGTAQDPLQVYSQAEPQAQATDNRGRRFKQSRRMVIDDDDTDIERDIGLMMRKLEGTGGDSDLAKWTGGDSGLQEWRSGDGDLAGMQDQTGGRVNEQDRTGGSYDLRSPDPEGDSCDLASSSQEEEPSVESDCPQRVSIDGIPDAECVDNGSHPEGGLLKWEPLEELSQDPSVVGNPKDSCPFMKEVVPATPESKEGASGAHEGPFIDHGLKRDIPGQLKSCCQPEISDESQDLMMPNCNPMQSKDPTRPDYSTVQIENLQSDSSEDHCFVMERCSTDWLGPRKGARLQPRKRATKRSPLVGGHGGNHNRSLRRRKPVAETSPQMRKLTDIYARCRQ